MNATVTMPIAELDALRAALKEETTKRTELESNQKLIKVEVRQQRETVSRDYSNSGGYVSFKPSTEWFLHPHVFINMDDAISQIRSEERYKVQNDIRRLEEKLKEKEAHVLQINKELTASFDIQAQIIEKKAKKDQAQERISRLEKELQAKTAMVEKLTKQTFWDRLFNPIEVISDDNRNQLI